MKLKVNHYTIYKKFKNEKDVGYAMLTKKEAQLYLYVTLVKMKKKILPIGLCADPCFKMYHTN